MINTHTPNTLVRYGFMALSLSLTSCVNLPEFKKQPLDLYYLDVLPLPEPTKDQSFSRLPLQIVIEEPQADTRFDSDYVVVNSGNSKVNYVRNVRWVARLPILVQEVFITLFEESDIVKGVGDPTEGFEADFSLLSDIKSFQLRIGETSTISIQIYGRLLRTTDREFIAAKLFSVNLPVTSETPEDVMEGFVKGINEITQEIIEWVHEQGRVISQKAPS